jgi:hypothetical protein
MFVDRRTARGLDVPELATNSVVPEWHPTNSSAVAARSSAAFALRDWCLTVVKNADGSGVVMVGIAQA